MMRRLLKNRRGASLVTLAIALPVVLLLVIGIVEVAVTVTISVALQDAAQKAAEVRSLSGSSLAEAEAAARAIMQGIVPLSEPCLSLAETGWASLADAGRPEGEGMPGNAVLLLEAACDWRPVSPIFATLPEGVFSLSARAVVAP